MKIAYFDCFAGASGDMILGALLDAGLDEAAWRAGLEKLDLSGYEIQVKKVHKGPIAATQVEVLCEESRVHRHLGDIEALINASGLPLPVQERSVAVFRRLAQAEARVHGESIENVHFHEVGAVDAIVDVVGAALGLWMMEVEEVYVSALPMGHGFVDCAHGRLPLPAPATVELAQGLPVVNLDVEAELVTPTGAALLSTLGTGFGAWPSMVLEQTGYGAGQRDLEFPNVLRLLVGRSCAALDAPTQNVEVLEANIDDMNPEFYGHVIQRLLDAGALDVYLTPVYMKKNRPGVVLSVSCRAEDSQRLAALVFAETTTIGIRRIKTERWALAREYVAVQTPFGEVGVKLARLGEQVVNASPEYEDCRRLALEHGVPLKEVYAAATAAARENRLLE
jgi:uncharacterized protein (TIGR00299 family) protein